MHGCGVRDREREGEIVYTYLHPFVLVYMGARLCVHVFEMYLHCVHITCECSSKLCVGA